MKRVSGGRREAETGGGRSAGVRKGAAKEGRTSDRGGGWTVMPQCGKGGSEGVGGPVAGGGGGGAAARASRSEASAGALRGVDAARVSFVVVLLWRRGGSWCDGSWCVSRCGVASSARRCVTRNAFVGAVERSSPIMDLTANMHSTVWCRRWVLVCGLEIRQWYPSLREALCKPF